MRRRRYCLTRPTYTPKCFSGQSSFDFIQLIVSVDEKDMPQALHGSSVTYRIKRCVRRRRRSLSHAAPSDHHRPPMASYPENLVLINYLLTPVITIESIVIYCCASSCGVATKARKRLGPAVPGGAVPPHRFSGPGGGGSVGLGARRALRAPSRG